MASKFKSIVKRLPYSWEKILGQGISFFISEQDPEEVRWDAVARDDEIVGWSITVKTNKENVVEAKEFWEEHVDPQFSEDN